MVSKRQSLSIYNYSEAVSRNIGILSEVEQKIISKQKVAIAGCGAEGGILALSLARLGIKSFNLADPKSFDLVDMNRQVCEIDDLRRNKCKVLKEKILNINPNARVKIFTKGLTRGAIPNFLNKVDFVIDALDYEKPELSILLQKSASEKDLYVFSGVSVGYGCNIFCFSPKGMGIEEFLKKREFSWAPKLPSYINKKIFKEVIHGEKPAPVIIIGVLAMASLLLTEIIKFITGKQPTTLPSYLHLDLRELKIEKNRI